MVKKKITETGIELVNGSFSKILNGLNSLLDLNLVTDKDLNLLIAENMLTIGSHVTAYNKTFLSIQKKFIKYDEKGNPVILNKDLPSNFWLFDYLSIADKDAFQQETDLLAEKVSVVKITPISLSVLKGIEGIGPHIGKLILALNEIIVRD